MLPNSDPRKNPRHRGAWIKISKYDSHILRGDIEVRLHAYGSGYYCVVRVPEGEVVFPYHLKNLYTARKFGEVIFLKTEKARAGKILLQA